MATLRDCYNDVVNNLDFKRIQSVMRFMNWTYGTDHHPPTIEELKRTCEELFNSACQYLLETNESRVTTSTGGFEVMVCKCIEDEKTIFTCSIGFVIEECITSTNDLE